MSDWMNSGWVYLHNNYERKYDEGQTARLLEVAMQECHHGNSNPNTTNELGHFAKVIIPVGCRYELARLFRLA